NYRLTLGRGTGYQSRHTLEREYQDWYKVAPDPSTRAHDDVDGNLELAGVGMVGLEDDLVIDEAGGRSRRHGHGQAVPSLQGRRVVGCDRDFDLFGLANHLEAGRPSLPLTATMRRIEGIRLIGPDAAPASTSWSLGCSGWSVSTVSSSRKVPRAMPGFNSRLTRYPPLALTFSSSLGVRGTGLAT